MSTEKSSEDKKLTYLQMALDAIKEEKARGGTSKQVWLLQGG